MNVKITLECSKCKQRNYNIITNKKHNSCIMLKKYCKFCKIHVIHKEIK